MLINIDKSKPFFWVEETVKSQSVFSYLFENTIRFKLMQDDQLSALITLDFPKGLEGTATIDSPFLHYKWLVGENIVQKSSGDYDIIARYKPSIWFYRKYSVINIFDKTLFQKFKDCWYLDFDTPYVSCVGNMVVIDAEVFEIKDIIAVAGLLFYKLNHNIALSS